MACCSSSEGGSDTLIFSICHKESEGCATIVESLLIKDFILGLFKKFNIKIASSLFNLIIAIC